MKRIIPIADRLKVRPEKTEMITKSGIILPDSALKEMKENKHSVGVVISRGRGTPFAPLSEFKENGREVVMFPSGAGIVVEEENDNGEKIEYRLLKYDEIIALL